MPPLRFSEAELKKLRTTKVQEWFHDTATPGLVACLGRTGTLTYYAQKRVGDKPVRFKIGRAGEPRPDDGAPWTLLLARKAADVIIGTIAQGKLPQPVNTKLPTLRDAMTVHIDNMRAEGCSQRSIRDIEKDLPRYMGAWLDRPIAHLTGETLKAEYLRIMENATERDGTNPLNKPGQACANRVVMQVSACWNAYNRLHSGALGAWNPAKSFKRPKLKPKRERLADTDLPSWWERVQSIGYGPLRDLLIFCLFTGMRNEAARFVHWSHVNFDRKMIEVPNPKGGEAKAFAIPIGPTVIELLQRRKAENVGLMQPYGGDHGWVFPSVTRAKPFRVQPIAEAKVRRKDADGDLVNLIPSPHVSRRTYISVADEIIPSGPRHVLVNHAWGSQTVNRTYIEESFDLLLACQERMDTALRERIKPRKRSGLVLLKPRVAAPAAPPKRKPNRIAPATTAARVR